MFPKSSINIHTPIYFIVCQSRQYRDDRKSSMAFMFSSVIQVNSFKSRCFFKTSCQFSWIGCNSFTPALSSLSIWWLFVRLYCTAAAELPMMFFIYCVCEAILEQYYNLLESNKQMCCLLFLWKHKYVGVVKIW